MPHRNNDVLYVDFTTTYVGVLIGEYNQLFFIVDTRSFCVAQRRQPAGNVSICNDVLVIIGKAFYAKIRFSSKGKR